MRASLLILALCLMTFPLAGCGDDSSSAMDLAQSLDMAAPGPDLSAGSDTCLQLLTCGANCGGMSTCVQACVDKGSPKALMQFQALVACAYGQCTVPGDSGTPACSSTSDTSMGCQSCASAAVQSAACAAQLSACLSG